MYYTCADARFFFTNGNKTYTVHFDYLLMTWYVFEEKKERSALYIKKVIAKKTKSPTRDSAEDILFEFLNSTDFKIKDNEKM